MHQVFTSWSGGKDSCLACYLATSNGLKVRYLANMITSDGRRSWSHGQTPQLLQTQAKAIGIPLIQHRSTRANYETEFKNMLRSLRQEDIEGGVFGDIDFEAHREWIDRVCREAGIVSHLPLWGHSQDEIMRQFVDLGFEAVVVAAKAEIFGEEVLGRRVDNDFINYLQGLKQANNITLCGEAGEYHTFVIDGPLFEQRVEILEAEKELKEGHRILKILKADLRAR